MGRDTKAEKNLTGLSASGGIHKIIGIFKSESVGLFNIPSTETAGKPAKRLKQLY